VENLSASSIWWGREFNDRELVGLSESAWFLADAVARDQILEVECPSTHFDMTVQSEEI
jgi:hypothetical protein